MTNINPDLVGEFEFRFEQHVPSADDLLLFVPSGAHPVVNINLSTVDTTVKLKHLYVYSCQGGFGKTRELDRLPHRAMHKAWRTLLDKHGVHLNRTGQSKYATMLETLCKVGGQPFELVGSKTSTLTLWCPCW